MTEIAQTELPPGARCAVHPEKSARSTCSRCGNFACESCETRSETGAILCKACEDQGSSAAIPWEERDKIGVVRAFAQTTIGVIIRPWELFQARPRERSILPALLFGWAASVPTTVLGALVNLISLDAQRTQLLASPYTRDMLWMAEPPFVLGMSLASLVLYPLVILFYAVLWHVPLLMFAGAKQSFAETMRGLAYVNAAVLPMLAALPVVAILNLVGLQTLGGLVLLPFSIYVYAVAGIAMWRVHRCDGWRVFAAVGVQWFGVFGLACLCTGAIVWMVLQSVPLPGLR